MQIEEDVTSETASFLTSHESRIQRLFNYSFKIKNVFYLPQFQDSIVVQFFPWFKFYFPLFLGMVMYDNEFNIKEKMLTKDKIEPQHIICVSLQILFKQ